jgi:hypothetical protein
MRSRLRGRSLLAGILGGVCLGLTAGWLLWRSDGVGVPVGVPEWTGGPWQPEPVLVIAVGTRESLDAVRRAVAPERIVASAEAGFAVEPRRVVVTGLEDAGDLLSRAGWSDHPVEIVDLGRTRDGVAPDDPAARVASFLDVRTLERGAALLLGRDAGSP